jgi:hypothetical protein
MVVTRAFSIHRLLKIEISGDYAWFIGLYVVSGRFNENTHSGIHGSVRAAEEIKREMLDTSLRPTNIRKHWVDEE